MNALEEHYLKRGIVEIRFRTYQNTLDDRLVGDLLVLLSELEDSSRCQGITLSGQGDRFFSPGFNLNFVSGLDRDQMAEFMRSFCRLYARIIGLTKPVLALLNGDALAGGCILACACPFRIASPLTKIGFTRITSFVGIPRGAVEFFSDLIGQKRIQRLITKGDQIRSLEAQRMGLIDRIMPADELYGFVQTGFRTLADGFESRTNLAQRVKSLDESNLDNFLDRWFSPEAKSALKIVGEELKISSGNG